MAFPLHILISDQSLEYPTSEIIVELDGQQIFNKKVVTGTQHNWEKITLDDIPEGVHNLVAYEMETNSTTSRAFTVNSELWILVVFYGLENGIRIDIHDQAVAFM